MAIYPVIHISNHCLSQWYIYVCCMIMISMFLNPDKYSLCNMYNLSLLLYIYLNLKVQSLSLPNAPIHQMSIYHNCRSKQRYDLKYMCLCDETFSVLLRQDKIILLFPVTRPTFCWNPQPKNISGCFQVKLSKKARLVTGYGTKNLSQPWTLG